MDAGEMLNSLTSSTGGLLGTIAAFCVAASVVFRKYWRGEKESSAESGARIDMLERFQNLLNAADSRAALADLRADKANAEKNELVAKLGAMTEQMSQMSRELAKMDGMREEIQRLTGEVNNLRKLVRADTK